MDKIFGLNQQVSYIGLWILLAFVIAIWTIYKNSNVTKIVFRKKNSELNVQSKTNERTNVIQKQNNLIISEDSDSESDYDIKLENYGNLCKIAYLTSIESIEELIQNVPQKIDRSDTEKYTYGRVYPISLDKAYSSHNWEIRRNLFFQHGHFKSGKHLFPTIIKIIDHYVDSYGTKKTISFNDLIFDISLTTTFSALFGEEIKHENGTIFIDFVNTLKKMNKFKVKNAKKKKKEHIYDAFQNLTNSAHTNFTNALERGVSDFTAIEKNEPFKTDKKNIDELHRVLLNYLTDSGKLDEMLSSDCNQEQEVTQEQILNDILHMMDAGSGSLYLVVVSILFRLKLHPEIKTRLQRELKRCGFKDRINTSEWSKNPELPGLLQQCDYLHYIVKECLRIDPPTADSNFYEAKEDVMGIKKGTKIAIDIDSIHHDEAYWHEPNSFIPERFDLDHRYYTVPGTDMYRSPLMYMPFSTGIRMCPGSIFALTTIKTIVAYFLCKYEYKLLKLKPNDDSVRFEIENETILYGRVIKK